MAKNNKNTNNLGGFFFIIVVIMISAIVSIIYSLWWLLSIIVLLIIIVLASVISVKYSKNKKNNHHVLSDKNILKIEQLKEKINKHGNLYPSLKNYDHEQYNNDYKNNLGILGENIVKAVLNKIAKNNDLVLLNNLYLASINNKVKQIDHLLITNDSLFIIETKNWQIPTYGDFFKKEWLQYHNNKKVFVPSPLQQNLSHIKTICNILNNHNISLNDFNVYNVVVFVKNNLKMKEYDEILSKTNNKALNLSELRYFINDRLENNVEDSYKECLKNIIAKIILECNKRENIEIHREQLKY